MAADVFLAPDVLLLIGPISWLSRKHTFCSTSYRNTRYLAPEGELAQTSSGLADPVSLNAAIEKMGTSTK